MQRTEQLQQLIQWLADTDIGLLDLRTPTAYSPPRMSPAVSLRPPAPPLFRCGEHTIDVIRDAPLLIDSTTRTCPRRRASGVSRSEIKEEPKAGDIRGGRYPMSSARAQTGPSWNAGTSHPSRLGDRAVDH